MQVCEGTFRGAGDTLTPLPVTGAIALINLILDPILMFKHNMGMAGAAVATVVAQYIGAALYLALLFFGGKRSPLHIEREEGGGVEGEKGEGKIGLWGHLVAALPVFGQLLAANGAMVVSFLWMCWEGEGKGRGLVDGRDSLMEPSSISV